MGDENNVNPSNSTDVTERLSKVETSLVIVKCDIKEVKEDVKDMKNRQSNSENSINDLTIAIKEQFAKQDKTNDYMKESIDYFKILLTKMTDRQDKYEDKNDERYIQTIKENSQQSLDNLKEVKSSEKETEEKMDKKIQPFKDWLFYIIQRLSWVFIGAIILLMISHGITFSL